MRGIASGKGDPPMKAAGLIAAAGLSSRMEDFKPLMELNGFPMIAMTVRSMRNAGIRNITVVTGFRGEEVRKVLDPLGVSIVENPRYRETDMLASVKLGLSSMDTGNGVFFLPGDVPLTEPETFRKLWNIREERAGKVSALIPMNGEKQIHPPYLSPEGCAGVLGYKGDFGLKGAMDAQDPLRVNVWDQGAGQDEDVPGDFRAMEQYAKAHRGVSERICENSTGKYPCRSISGPTAGRWGSWRRIWRKNWWKPELTWTLNSAAAAAVFMICCAYPRTMRRRRKLFWRKRATWLWHGSWEPTKDFRKNRKLSAGRRSWCVWQIKASWKPAGCPLRNGTGKPWKRNR